MQQVLKRNIRFINVCLGVFRSERWKEVSERGKKKKEVREEGKKAQEQKRWEKNGSPVGEG